MSMLQRDLERFSELSREAVDDYLRSTLHLLLVRRLGVVQVDPAGRLVGRGNRLVVVQLPEMCGPGRMESQWLYAEWSPRRCSAEGGYEPDRVMAAMGTYDRAAEKLADRLRICVAARGIVGRVGEEVFENVEGGRRRIVLRQDRILYDGGVRLTDRGGVLHHAGEIAEERFVARGREFNTQGKGGCAVYYPRPEPVEAPAEDRTDAA